MISQERHHRIIQYLQENRYASLHDIVALVNASEATVRRDFNSLEEAGILRRVHGGVELANEEKAPPFFQEPPFEHRKIQLAETKRAIAREAAGLCSNDETIMIDGGSTTYYLAEFLREKRLQIITNSFAIAEELISRSSNRIIILGGMIYRNSRLILNPFDFEHFLGHYYAAKLFMGVGGIDENGASNTEMLLIETERAMIKQCKRLIIMCDSSKFSRQGNLFLCGFDSIDTIITDSGIPDDYRDMLLSKGIRLQIV